MYGHKYTSQSKSLQKPLTSVHISVQFLYLSNDKLTTAWKTVDMKVSLTSCNNLKRV